MSEERWLLLDYALRHGTMTREQHAAFSRLSDEEWQLATQLIEAVALDARQAVLDTEHTNFLDAKAVEVKRDE